MAKTPRYLDRPFGPSAPFRCYPNLRAVVVPAKPPSFFARLLRSVRQWMRKPTS